jgi:hypothetical protein
MLSQVKEYIIDCLNNFKLIFSVHFKILLLCIDLSKIEFHLDKYPILNEIKTSEKGEHEERMPL